MWRGRGSRRGLRSEREQESLDAEYLAVSFSGFFESGRRRRRIENSLGDLTLALDREANNLRFLDRTASGFIRGGHNEIRQRAPPDFGGALQTRHYLVRQARLQPGGGWGFLFHCAF